jgi:SAM-dependent methyltransferase
MGRGRVIDGCRACGHTTLRPVLSLGATPLANGLLDRASPGDEARYPLDVVFCPACALVQITETIPPEALFRDYPYLSSVSETAVRNAEAIVARTVDARALGAPHLAIEIASNDGYLLRHYRARGVRVLGIEPARNIAGIAAAQGIDTVPEFFSSALARRLRSEGRAADVVHANNVLAHVPALGDVVDGVALLLKPDGCAIVEVPYVRDMVERLEFDTIYHEHLCYFSAISLASLFDAHGLTVVDVERIPIHGGTLRVTAQPAAAPPRASDRVARLLAEEAALGMDRLRYYAGFSDRVSSLRSALRGLLDRLKADGHRIAAYGASAKGTTLLSYCGIGRETLDFVVDRSPLKQGKLTPGTRLPIDAPARLTRDMPDFTLLLTWNFADEIAEQQREYLARGGRFIVPVPWPEIVGA